MDIPTYHEAIQQGGEYRTEPSAVSSMGSQIASVQRDRVRSAMNKHIRPLLQSQVEAGLSEMVFALVPSDCDPLEGSNPDSSPDVIEKARSSYVDYFAEAPAAEIVSFEGSDYVRVIRLHGPENIIHFWRQPAVIKTLLGEVRLALGLSEESKPAPPPMPIKDIRDMTKAERREYKQKISVGILSEGIGWRVGRASEGLQPGEIDVSVNVDELAIRRLTEVGLYETRTGRAIIVKVLVGS